MSDTPTPRERAEELIKQLAAGIYLPLSKPFVNQIERAITAAVEAAREDERRRIWVPPFPDEKTEQAAFRRGAEAAREQIAACFEDKVWAKTRYNEGLHWSGELGAFSPHKHALACAAAIRRKK